MCSLAEDKQMRWPHGLPRGPVGVSCPERQWGKRAHGSPGPVGGTGSRQTDT